MNVTYLLLCYIQKFLYLGNDSTYVMVNLNLRCKTITNFLSKEFWKCQLAIIVITSGIGSSRLKEQRY